MEERAEHRERPSGEQDDPRRQPGQEDEQDAQPAEPDTLGAAAAHAEAEMKKLQGGPAVSLFGASLPIRSLLAIAIFVAVFMVVLLFLWAAAGGVGLGLGWILAALAGLVAVKLYGDRAAG